MNGHTITFAYPSDVHTKIDVTHADGTTTEYMVWRDRVTDTWRVYAGGTRIGAFRHDTHAFRWVGRMIERTDRRM